MEIYLIRHTTVDNPDQRCYGQSDILLTATWQNEFDQVKNKLGEINTDAVFYSSPFERCTKLAGFLSGRNLRIDERLSEMHFGNWEQLPWSSIETESLNDWMADYVNYRVPGGENFSELQARCIQFWNHLLIQPHTEMFIVTHAGVIRSLLAHLLQIPLNKVFQLNIDYSSVTRINVNVQHGNTVTIPYINR